MSLVKRLLLSLFDRFSLLFLCWLRFISHLYRAKGAWRDLSFLGWCPFWLMKAGKGESIVVSLSLFRLSLICLLLQMQLHLHLLINAGLLCELLHHCLKMRVSRHLLQNLLCRGVLLGWYLLWYWVTYPILLQILGQFCKKYVILIHLRRTMSSAVLSLFEDLRMFCLEVVLAELAIGEVEGLSWGGLAAVETGYSAPLIGFSHFLCKQEFSITD